MPPDVNRFDTSLMENAISLAKRWHEADPDRMGVIPVSVAEEDVQGWSPDTICAFATKLGQFAATKPLTSTCTRAIGDLYKLDAVRNPEVRACHQLLWPINPPD